MRLFSLSVQDSLNGEFIVTGDTIASGSVNLTEYIDAQEVSVKVYHQNEGISISKPINGRINILADNSHVFSISISAQNDDLNINNELLVYIENNNLNRFMRNYSIQIINNQNNSIIDEFLNGQIAVQTRNGGGINQVLFTIPNLNSLGSGFTIELR